MSNENKRVCYKLSTEFKVMLARILQLALLTGTDITDNLSLVVVEGNSDGEVVPTPEYQAVFEANIMKMLAQAEEMLQDAGNEEDDSVEEN